MTALRISDADAVCSGIAFLFDNGLEESEVASTPDGSKLAFELSDEDSSGDLLASLVLLSDTIGCAASLITICFDDATREAPCALGRGPASSRKDSAEVKLFEILSRLGCLCQLLLRACVRLPLLLTIEIQTYQPRIPPAYPPLSRLLVRSTPRYRSCKTRVLA